MTPNYFDAPHIAAYCIIGIVICIVLALCFLVKTARLDRKSDLDKALDADSSYSDFFEQQHKQYLRNKNKGNNPR